jgi:hypothetical protein
MSRFSPTLEGFRAVFRRPSLTLAEIIWRWTVGALAGALWLFWFVEYLKTLPVTTADAALLSTRQPLLVGRAISHILRGSLNRAAFAALFAALALSLLWVIASSIGRTVTVRVLLDYFAERKEAAAGASAEAHEAIEPRPLRPLICLNFLRAVLALGAILAFLGAAILSSLISSDANPQPGLAFILFLPLAGLICLVWPALNWLLSLASVFAVRDGEDALGSLSAAVTFFREHSGPMLAVSTWTGLAHLVAFSVATTVVSVPLAFIRVAPPRLVIASVILLTLAYFAVVDWLYAVRLAGYVSIAEMPQDYSAPSSLPLPSPPGTALPVETGVDRDERILSDIQGLAVET